MPVSPFGLIIYLQNQPVMRQFSFLVGWICLFVGLYSKAQQPTTSYYELPQNRSGQGVLGIPLPHMKAEKIKWFIQAEGGFSFADSRVSSNLEGLLSQRRSDGLHYGFHAGYTERDLWKVSVGYQNTPLQTLALLGSSRTARILSNSWGGPADGIALRYQRRIITLDRVTRSAHIMAGGGLVQLLPGGRRSLGTVGSNNLFDNVPANRIDTLFFQSSAQQNFRIPALEAQMEVNGLLSDVLEISAYLRGHFSLQQRLQNQISVTFPTGDRLQSTQILQGTLIQVGISISYNYFRYNRYREKLD